jgi:hypothetical protein
MSNEVPDRDVPKAFISYSWDSSEHKQWVKEFAARLRADGVDVTLDHWAVVPGDQLPRFMETAVRENGYVLIICTPNYKTRSDGRLGGVGYEGDIMTAEVLTQRNDRKFIPVLRSGNWEASMPSWLGGKYSITLSGDPYPEHEYIDLLTTLHNTREQAPPVGKAPQFQKSVREAAKVFIPATEKSEAVFDPIKIEGVLADEAGRPTNDGSPGSALYSIPFKLSRQPSAEWAYSFIQNWDRPRQHTSRHRPGIARVQGDRIVLMQTTIEEVKQVHRDTLKLVVDTVNMQVAGLVRDRRAREEAAARKEQEDRDTLHRIAEDIKFD